MGIKGFAIKLIGKQYVFPSVFLLIFFNFLIVTNVSAQTKINVDATIDSTKIKIGEQLHLNLTAEVSNDITLFFPQIPDSLNHLEVVDRTKIDTLKSKDGKYTTYSQTLTLTSFDAGTYFLEPFKFYYKNNLKTIDSISTSTLTFKVETVAVDTTKEIKDIKPPLEIPFSWREVLPYLITAVIVLIAILILVWCIRKWRVKKGFITPNIPLRPAHEIALEELKKIRNQSLWQQGFYKQYQSAVSDTIRTYIEQRFSIQAMEMTSDETLQHFREKNKKLIPKKALEKLSYILTLADTVKFAKAVPLGTENEISMQNAFDFIALTKPASKSDFDNLEKETPEHERKEDKDV